jgi:hypothetical protein
MARMVETGGSYNIDSQAALDHQRGLNLEVDAGDYIAAHEAFEAALNRLQELPSSPSTELQAARVVRDDGFTYVREKQFGQAFSMLNLSLTRTTHLLRSEGRLPDLLAEHGATLGVLARVAVAEQVSEGKFDARPTRKQRAKLVYEQHWFGRHEAHGCLRDANNAYYRVSNAMQAARAERLNGRPLHIAPWLGRAAVGLVQAAKADRANFLPAIKTAVRLGGVLLGHRRSVVASVKARP